jgi:cation:H+ antiporter
VTGRPAWLDGLVFAVSAAVSLRASGVLVVRLERLGERLGLTEAMLGLLAALCADAPEITSAVTALVRGQRDVGVGVVLGSNVFNLAALLGLGAVVAGGIALHRRVIVLDGAVALWMAVVALLVVGTGVGPGLGLALVLAVVAPYVTVSAAGTRRLARLEALPRRWRLWLVRAVRDEEIELLEAIRPAPAQPRDIGVALLALLLVLAGSIAMEDAGSSLGSRFGVPDIVVGGLLLAAVTSLPNAVAALHLARRGRGAATLATALNSNTLNVVAGLLMPAVATGLGRGESAGGLWTAWWFLGLTLLTLLLAYLGRGLGRRAGASVIAAYLVFAVVLGLR